MFRGIVAGVAVLFASAPAGAVVVLQVTRTASEIFEFGTYEFEEPGRYRLTAASDELVGLNATGYTDVEGSMAYQYWENWQPVPWNANENNVSRGDTEYVPNSPSLELVFDFLPFEDRRDENGTGYTFSYNLVNHINIQWGNSKAITYTYTIERFALPSVPEPATWAMMIAGLGMAGAAMRRRRAATAPI